MTMDDSVAGGSDSTSTAQLAALAAASHASATATPSDITGITGPQPADVPPGFESGSEDETADARYADARLGGGDTRLAPGREPTLAVLREADDEDVQVVGHQLSLEGINACEDGVGDCRGSE